MFEKNEDESTDFGSLGLKLTKIYLLLIFGGIPLAAYVGVISLNQISINELGDFLAGVFGPVAIFWLVLGFFQQSVELRTSTAALRLQAEELRASVKAQESLVIASAHEFTFSNDARRDDLWLEIKKAETDIFLALESCEQILPRAKKIQHGNFANRGLFHSGVREQFDIDHKILSERVTMVRNGYDKNFPIPPQNEWRPNSATAHLAYYLRGLVLATENSLQAYLKVRE